MTEIMKKIGMPNIAQAPASNRYIIDPVAFFLALICAPLMVALLGFWVIGIPVFALYFGGPAYLALGTPILLIYLRRAVGTPKGAAALAFCTVAVGLAALLIALSATSARSNIEIVAILGGFGLVIGPLWGLTFGYLYDRWRTPLSRRPLPLFA